MDDGQAEEDDPEDVVRIRVKEGPPHFGMVPNNHHDDHFDLREPEKILGKTIWYLNRLGNDPLSKSLTFLGLALWGKIDEALQLELPEVVEGVAEEVLKVSDKDAVVHKLNNAKQLSFDIDSELLKKSQLLLAEQEPGIIEEQKKLYIQWSKERMDRIKEASEKQKRKEQLDNITYEKEKLSREEEKLFFFENFDKLEMEKDEKLQRWKSTFPRVTWSLPGYFHKKKYIKKPGEDRKVARWERREAKRGPPK